MPSPIKTLAQSKSPPPSAAGQSTNGTTASSHAGGTASNKSASASVTYNVGSVETAPATRRVGRLVGLTLGAYRLERLLGRGEAGETYQAWDTTLERGVAVKVLPPELASDPLRRRALILEAREAARLRHPNLLGVRHSGTHGEQIFVVRELMEGGSVSDWLASRKPTDPADPPFTVQVVAAVARGLAFAHQQGIIHRNLKPGNILAGSAGEIKVADFGVTVRNRSGGATTLTGRGLRSALYQSPEHFRNDLLDPRSDVYSLGAIWFAMLTGRPPFPGSSLNQVAHLHQAAAVPDPRRWKPETPDVVADLVRRCLSKDPDHRPPSMDALLAELSRLGLTDTLDTEELEGSASWSRFWSSVMSKPLPTHDEPESSDLIPEYGPPSISTGLSVTSSDAHDRLPINTKICNSDPGNTSPDTANDSDIPFAEPDSLEISGRREHVRADGEAREPDRSSLSWGCRALPMAGLAVALGIAAAIALWFGGQFSPEDSAPPSAPGLTQPGSMPRRSPRPVADQPNQRLAASQPLATTGVKPATGAHRASLDSVNPAEPTDSPEPAGDADPTSEHLQSYRPVAPATAMLEFRELAELADRRNWTPEDLASIIARFERLRRRVPETSLELDIEARLVRLRKIQRDLLAEVGTTPGAHWQ